MGWNYRLVRKTYEKNVHTIGIHEAYYDDNNKIWSISAEPIRMSSTWYEDISSLEDIMQEFREDLEHLATALTKPILNYGDIPEDGAVGPRVELDYDKDGNICEVDEDGNLTKCEPWLPKEDLKNDTH